VTTVSIENLMELQFDVVVVPEVQDDGTVILVASHPDLPGCMSHGDTLEEALLSLEDARRLYLETLLDLGLPTPMQRETRSFLEIVPDEGTIPTAAAEPILIPA
jgi:predicted RNase H-like HicB family nuclease